MTTATTRRTHTIDHSKKPVWYLVCGVLYLDVDLGCVRATSLIVVNNHNCVCIMYYTIHMFAELYSRKHVNQLYTTFTKSFYPAHIAF